MGRILTVASQKGGVGKTTTTLNLGFSLSRLGSRVLLIDGDPQGGIAIASNLKKRTQQGLVDVLQGRCAAADIVMTTKDQALSIVGIGHPAPEEVFALEDAARDGRLGRLIREMAEGFDYLLIDAPAGIGGLVAALLEVSDGAILVAVPRMLSLKSLPSFFALTQWVRENRHAGLGLEGVVLTMTDESSEAENALRNEFRGSLPDEIFFRTQIPADQLFETASNRAIPVAMLSGGQRAAKPYLDLALELKEREVLHSKEGADDDATVGLF
ncbi:MAG: ParA family protein [Desulfuromonadales bacterium]|jgi:chromosome partitioning protein